MQVSCHLFGAAVKCAQVREKQTPRRYSIDHDQQDWRTSGSPWMGLALKNWRNPPTPDLADSIDQGHAVRSRQSYNVGQI